MNFQTMEYFKAVEEEGTFTAAARKLHITQQTLSAGIAHLEKEIGCQLFHRTNPIELTYAGTVFRTYAEDFLKKYYAMQKEFQVISYGNEGVLHVGIGYTRGRMLMPSLISKFEQKYPLFQIVLKEGSTEELHQMLLNNEAEIAIGNFRDMRGEIEYSPFYNEEVVLLVKKTLLQQCYGEQWEELIRQVNEGHLEVLETCPFIMSIPDDTVYHIARYHFEKYNFQPKIKVSSDNLTTLLTLCVQGVGACFCPRNYAEMTLSEKQLSSLQIITLSEEASYQIFFGVLRQGNRWKVLDDFMRIAKEAITQ